ncbi:hypothetical protein AD998_05755 [bacterium 336/3]|nr:hypothetical protein AD998_05755 [bacterium 336/3]
MPTHDDKMYMIIDDDVINNMVCQLIIKSVVPNTRTLCFVNPLEALEYLTNKDSVKPEIILLDINMPEIDGWQFLEKYENLDINTKIVILSSSSNESDKYRAEKHPLVVNYVSKPLTIEKLMKIVRNVVDNE